MYKLKYNLVFISLLMILFIDGLGFSLVLPLFPEMVLIPQKSILPITYTEKIRNLFYGISLVSFPFGMFFGAPILGQLSDKIGRKKVLIYSLLGTAIGYFISGISIYLKSFAFFFIGRLIDGITAGSVPVAQASMIDISPKDKNVGNMGLILFAVTSGYFIGPIFSDFLSKKFNILNLGLGFPFYVTSILSLLSIILLSPMKDKAIKKSIKSINIFSAFKTLKSFIRISTAKHLLLSFLFFQLGWTMYFQYIPHFLTSLSLNNLIVPLLFSLGLGMAISFCILTRIFQKLFVSYKGALIFSIIVAISILGNFFTNKLILMMVGLIAGAGYGLCYSFILATLSNEVSKDKQGLLMGTTASMSALSSITTALAGTFLININTYSSILTSFVCIVISILLLIKK